MKKKKISQFILLAGLTVLCLAVVYPLLLVLGTSFSDIKDISQYGYSVFPKNFDLSAYKYVFKNFGPLLQAYKVTAIFSVSTMVFSVLLMAMIAYPLSRSTFRFSKGLSFYLFFTMLFNGGLVPTFILITQYLNLSDNILVYILPVLISPWYVFMIRTFFQGIPVEIIESAYIDGASEYRIFFTMILPLSKPVLATVALMTFLSKWNDWYTAMLYINDDELISLQYFLQRILKNIEIIRQQMMAGNSMESMGNIPSETVRMAMAIVVAGPALFVFPFFQKYFVKGITVGSVKG